MKALRFDGELRLVDDQPMPRREGEALVKVLCAGICNTDLEITKGYAGFTGTIGHEFVGRVVESPGDELLQKRVVGEINVGCQECADCEMGDARHCPNRTVLGIKGRDGAFAEYLSLPLRNLIELPDSISDEEAVFIEPLAAACNILEQVQIGQEDCVAVIGDGKLAQLIIRVLAQTGCSLTLIGKHPAKLQLAAKYASPIWTGESLSKLPPWPGQSRHEKFDVVIEASGSPDGLPVAVQLVKPRGTIILKSTHHLPTVLDLSPVVVQEIKLFGSRCGRFHAAIRHLMEGNIDLSPLISGRYPLEEGMQAFAAARQTASLKILLRIAEE